MYKGIPNKGNTCFKASVFQALRSCLGKNELVEKAIQTLKPSLTAEDACEFYTNWMETSPLRDKFNIIFTDKNIETNELYIKLDINGDILHQEIIETSDFVCIRMITKEETIRSMAEMKITYSDKSTSIYNLCSCICYTGGHYYCVSLEDEDIIVYNDGNVYHGRNVHPIYMSIYKKSK